MEINSAVRSERGHRAREVADVAFAADSKNPAQLRIGWVDARIGDARETLERAIALDPDYVQAHYVLGRVLKRLRRLEDAKREIATAEKIQAKQRAQYAKKLGSEEHP